MDITPSISAVSISGVAISTMVEELALALREQGRTLTTVESCTGGMLGAAITRLAGISDVYLGGLVTYSNMSKQLLAGVNPRTIDAFGAVSSQVAIEMALGGCSKLLATNGIAITGIAGPDGGSDDKPVGTVWICVAKSSGAYDARRFVFPGDRDAVREQTLATALTMCIGQHAQKTQTQRTQALEHEHEQLSA